MITEKHVLEEARNIALNAPVWPGDTLSHAAARECERRGWATRDCDGNWIPTSHAPFTLARPTQRGMQVIDQEGLRKVLKRRAKEAGSFRLLSAELGYSHQYLHVVSRGEKPFGRRLAAALGYEEVVRYRAM